MASDHGSPDRTRPAWQHAIAAERMAVDREFADQVSASSLSPESWELVMTAVELKIERPGDPSAAQLVANTERLPSVLPAIASIEQRHDHDGPGLLARLRGYIPGVDGPQADRRRTAEALARTYARELRERLEETGQWEQVCAMAATDEEEPV